MVFKVLGVVFLLSGLVFIFAPGAVERMKNLGQKLIFSDEAVVRHRLVMGIFFVCAAALMFVFGYLVERWDLGPFFRRLLL